MNWRFWCRLCMVPVCLALLGPNALSAPIKLQVAMWINDAPEIEQTQQILREYEAANPGVQLELIQQPWTGFHEKLITLVASGQAPDVMVVNRSYVPSFAANGFMRPVNDWLAKEKFSLTTDVAEMASGTYQGKIYGIPIWGGPHIALVNINMFDEAGQPRPADLVKANAWTWENVVSIGKKITRDLNGDGTIDQWMLLTPSTDVKYWAQKVLAYGGRVFNEAKTETLLDRPEAIAGLRLHADLLLNHRIAVPLGVNKKFEEGGVALGDAWAAETPNFYKRVDGRFVMDIAPMPSGPAGMFHFAGGCPVAVSATTPHPEAAYRFAVWFAMYSREWQLRGIPANMNTIRREYRQYLSQYVASPDVVVQAMMGRVEMEPSVHLKSSDLKNIWNASMDQLRRGEVAVETVAAELTRQLNAVLRQQ